MAANEANQTVIVVESGMVAQIFSTIPADEHIIEVLDLDSAGQESPEAKDAMEARVKEVSMNPEYEEII